MVDVDGDALKKVNNSGYQPILVILGNVIICIEVCQAIPALVDGGFPGTPHLIIIFNSVVMTLNNDQTKFSLALHYAPRPKVCLSARYAIRGLRFMFE
jgi:hypothetical protein